MKDHTILAVLLKKYWIGGVLVAILLLSLYSCTCLELSDEFLTQYQRSLIPYEMATPLVFIDQNKQQVNGSVTDKISDSYLYDRTESCDPANAERQRATVKIPSKGLSLEVRVNALAPTFEIAFDESVYTPSCPFNENLAQTITDVEVDGFVYQDVFRFEYCIFQDSNIAFIVFSEERGIEFIKYDDGSYLKLMD